MIATWVKRQDFEGNNLTYINGFSIGTKGYVVGGYGGGSQVWEYDSSGNIWTQKASFGGGNRYAAMDFAIGTKGYICCGVESGYIYKKDLWEYDSSANTWTQKTNFPGTARYAGVGFSIGYKGYVGGGFDNNYKSDFYEWDSTASTWTQKTNIPFISTYPANFSIGSYGYAGLGYYQYGSPTTFYKYNPFSNAWTAVASPGIVIYAGGYTTKGNKGYILGGSSRTFYEYDSSANTWVNNTDAALPYYLTYGKAWTIDNNIYWLRPATKEWYVYANKLDAPSNLTAVKNEAQTEVTLTWIDNETVDTNIVIERKIDGVDVDFSTFQTVAPDSSAYVDTTVDLGNYSYWYRVKSIKA